MTQSGRTFSESWHRVCDLRVALRPTVTVRTQNYRGEPWYLLHDPFNNNFFRLRPEAYQFVARLRPDRTVEQVWEECLARYPESAPGQEDAIGLLTQLHRSNLLYHRGTADSTAVFERYEERHRRELAGWFMSILSPQFHLFDPDALFNRLRLVVRLVTGPLAALLWIVIVGYALSLLAGKADLLRDQAEGILDRGNWALFYAGVILVKTVHELGHAVLCKRFGGDVHNIGLTLLVFTPLPFVDATSAWGLRSRLERMLVGAGGMIAELFVASLAAIIWASSGQGTIHALTYNIMWIASVSTILFNVNPLVRFDGYYILSDMLDVPNLQPRSMEQLVYLAEHYLFGSHQAQSPSQGAFEGFWLTVYGILSGGYRWFLSFGIILFVADRFLVLGLIMAAIAIVAWVVMPVWGLCEYLATNPRIARKRVRAVAVTVGCVALVLGGLGAIPAPDRYRAPGVVEPVHQVEVATEVPGRLHRIVTPAGAMVSAGTPLVELTNPELEQDIQEGAARLSELDATMTGIESRSTADIAPLTRRIRVMKDRLVELKNQQSYLTVRARLAGRWIAPETSEKIGMWVPRGSPLGKIVDDSAFRFVAVVPQDEASSLFLGRAKLAQVRLLGEAGTLIDTEGLKVIPFQQGRLPSRALGWRGGGEIAVAMDDNSGMQAAEPFFEIQALLKPVAGMDFLTGSSGRLGLTFGYTPFLWQWTRKLRQMVQRRYHL